jgi:hypothetical protein
MDFLKSFFTIAVIGQYAKELAMTKTRLNYLLDIIIGSAFIAAGGTGIAFLFLGSGGFQGGRNPAFSSAVLGLNRAAWNDLHTLSGLVMIAGIVLHLIFHWRWIVCSTKQILANATRTAKSIGAAE